jgi:hypothetical protein
LKPTDNTDNYSLSLRYVLPLNSNTDWNSITEVELRRTEEAAAGST